MKKKSFKHLKPWDFPLYFIWTPIILGLPVRLPSNNGEITFDEYCKLQALIFKIANELGTPVEWRNNHYYIFFKGTWRIITRRSFQQFMDQCEKRMGIAQ